MHEHTDSTDFFKALADETRFKIFLTLARNRGRLCVNAIVKKLGLSQPAVSQHLKILKIARIADSAREGHKIQYGINREFIQKVLKKIGLLVAPQQTPARTEVREEVKC